MEAGRVVWTPGAEQLERSGVARYLRWLAAQRGLAFEGYDALWRWSVDDLTAFWRSVCDFGDILATGSTDVVLEDDRMPGARWFPDLKVNFAEHLLRGARAAPAAGAGAPASTADGEDASAAGSIRRKRAGAPALIAVPEGGRATQVSWDELRGSAGALARTLQAVGVRPGDRVAAYVPNMPEAVVGLVACASIGAVWAACPPELAPAAALARLAPLEPTVLIAAGSYRYAGREHRRDVAQIAAGLPDLRAVICVGEAPPAGPRALPWSDAVADPAEPTFARLPFDHPLWVLFSSGTTGPPKGIVHGHGGILLELLKNVELQLDVRAGDRCLMVANTGWMVWNVLVGTLLAGATAVLVDGSPVHPDLGATWRVAAQQRATLVGAGAGLLHAGMKAGLRPGRDHDLSSLRTVLSTGSPLSADGFAWVVDAVGPHVWPNSASGGTEVCSALVAGSPILPVRAGRISARCLGAAVEAWDDAGRPAAQGELVVTKPMPSMPFALWGDEDGSRYRDAYFSTFPGAWRHGDLIELDADGSSVIHGRSDATINRNGVRLGSEEIYAAVERLPDVRDSLVVGVELGAEYYLPLYVQLADGADLDAARERIVAAIRAALSPRHVPDEIVPVPGVPRTTTGKRLEVPVKRLLEGADPASVVDRGSVDRPELLEVYAELAGELRSRW